jgi:hypothetical protein
MRIRDLLAGIQAESASHDLSIMLPCDEERLSFVDLGDYAVRWYYRPHDYHYSDDEMDEMIEIEGCSSDDFERVLILYPEGL